LEILKASRLPRISIAHYAAWTQTLWKKGPSPPCEEGLRCVLWALAESPRIIHYHTSSLKSRSRRRSAPKYFWRISVPGSATKEKPSAEIRLWTLGKIAVVGPTEALLLPAMKLAYFPISPQLCASRQFRPWRVGTRKNSPPEGGSDGAMPGHWKRFWRFE
jgi:hypothetical protein